MVASLVDERQCFKHLKLDHGLNLAVLNLSQLDNDVVALGELIYILLNHEHERIVLVDELVEGTLKILQFLLTHLKRLVIYALIVIIERLPHFQIGLLEVFGAV